MYDSIERGRQGCNLQGALQTLTEIRGVVPILHSTSGCGIQNYYANKSGLNKNGFLGGYEIPNTNVFEKQVIFGGTSRLREQIKNTVKVLKGDLYVVLSGCEAEMVGDDSISMTQEIVDQGEKAIYYKAPGFAGNQYTGYVGVLDAIINKLPNVISLSTEIKKGLVNIFGILPKQDIYWKGNLAEIDRLLRNVGIKVNTLFGYGQGLDQWKTISNAELNIVVSKWGIPAAEKLKEKYGTPYVVFDHIGLGEEIEDFVRTVAKELGTDLGIVEEYLLNEKKKFVYALEQFAEYAYVYDFQKPVAIVGDESTVIRYSRFLTKYWGIDIEIAIITDFIGSAEDQVISASLQGIANEIYFSKDTSTINKIIKAGNIELILGSGLENTAAEKLKIPNYIVSYPAYHKVIISQSDIGYQGAVFILEELSSLLINNSHFASENE
jgi:nitrogenase molybdenum-iron protein beta chain